MRLYTKNTDDELNLPIAVAATVEELSEMTGDSRATIWGCIYRGSRRFHAIDVEGGEEDGKADNM